MKPTGQDTTTFDRLEWLGPTPRVALLRGGGLGDFLSTTAALRALRTALPRATITLITNSAIGDFARRYQEIDHIVVAPSFPGVVEGVPDKRAQDQFFDAMRAERFDLAMQWHGGGTQSNHFINRLGARLTIGFKGNDAEPLDLWIPYDIRQHETLRYLDLLRLLGIQATEFPIVLPVLESDREELQTVANALDLEALRRGNCMGIHASAGGLSRRWAPERFAYVADRLVDEFGLEYVLVTAGPGQEADSAAVVSHMAARDRAVDLAGKISLGALVALIAQLRFLLSNDSGPAHMAVALDTPSVVVFGSAHPVNWAPLDRTLHRVVANWAAPCRWMVDDGCQDTPEVACLLGVQPEDVLAEARQLLGLLERMEKTGPPWPGHSPQRPSKLARKLHWNCHAEDATLRPSAAAPHQLPKPGQGDRIPLRRIGKPEPPGREGSRQRSPMA